ncbi:hypothetical protein M231_06784 [Tremella mesenterica]|uniref:Enoyl reductase (ER) domain-containing protein n=1 Tax=Tremella mesenterica TaxID=5217 RepID=A0A4Q1BG13_TREME|nr:hypothetical protein M231_06784 [Tremella mesenterica]
MTKINELIFETRPLPSAPGPFERVIDKLLTFYPSLARNTRRTWLNDSVVVAPKMTGLCGSDMHVFLEGRAGESLFSDPLVLGHEAAGVVTQVGERVTSVKVGDRVALEPGEACLRCEFCKGGEYGQCGNFKFAAADGHDGTLQGFYTLPADIVYKLPPHVSLAEGALMEPLAVAVMAVHSVAKLGHNQNVAVFGTGPVGLLTLAVAKALGARRLLAIDINEDRLKFAASYLGAETHLAIPKNPGESMIDYSKRHGKAIQTIFGFGERGEGVDLVVECSGAEVCVQTGIWLVKRRGKCVQVGAGPAHNTIPMSIFVNKEVTLIGSLRYGPGCYPMAIDLVARGLIDLKPLHTHTFSFDEAPKAFETTKKQMGPDGKPSIKVMSE